MTKKEKDEIRGDMLLTKFCLEEAKAARKRAEKINDIEDFGYRTGLMQGYIEFIHFCEVLLGEEKE